MPRADRTVGPVMVPSSAAAPEPAAALAQLAPPTRHWFERAFGSPTPVQVRAWPVIARHEHALLLAPTGAGKTLAAFLVALDELMFGAAPAGPATTRLLYVSPLKALGADIERNLRAPLAGLTAAAVALGVAARIPRVGVRSGDTSPEARRELAKAPPEILITTPESLYLMLTSRMRTALAGVERVIIDEIHVMAASKRGVHLALSLERLEWLRHRCGTQRPLQRIGLSATQRPVEEAVRFLGGFTVTAEGVTSPRPVTVVTADQSKPIELRVELPAEDASTTAAPPTFVEGSAALAPPLRGSVWPSIHPRLLELIRAHRSTLVFVNSRRLAERIAAAVNELAGEDLVASHHGSVAKEVRSAIEERLKRGELAGLIATSSLELGIDMGAVDLVVQIEAPPSLASGLQRIGRAGHRIDAVSKGVLIPKYRADLLASAAAARALQEGRVEATRYPRNPLDVLAQQVVAACAMEDWSVEDLWCCVRGSAPYAELPRGAFEGVLDLLAGRYPSEAFAGLRARITWDRVEGRLTARKGAGRIAIVNAGTIPDRGLYGVYLAEGEGSGRRVGELDEEMVHEARPGEIFLLGSSSWRILEITHDRVLVSPAPGEPGRMPFWRGEGPGRPLDFGRAIGALTREVLAEPREVALRRLCRECALTGEAAAALLDHLEDQRAATGVVPDDAQLLVERFIDEVGDWRILILSPFGARVHAPWAITVAERLRARSPGEVDVIWSDDGIVFRLPQADEAPGPDLLVPAPEEVEEELLRALGGTALFAARFRENAARALLLPRRSPGRRQPLWAQRRRAADLLAVAARFDRFPLLLETCRECLCDVFDLDGLRQVLTALRDRRIALDVVDTRQASPFAASMLFGYVANFLYEGDTPLAERRAQALALDPVQLRELLGTAELRLLLDADVIEAVTRELAGLTDEARARCLDADAIHDLLLAQGDLSLPELGQRLSPQLAAEGAGAGAGGVPLEALLEALEASRRVLRLRVNGETRCIAAEDAARYRDALGVVLPAGLPAAFLESVPEPLVDIIGRHARVRGPFTLPELATRYGLGTAPVQMVLERLVARGRLVEGEFRPGGQGREWCETEALRRIKRRSLARLRAEVEPVDSAALGRFLPEWQGLSRPRRGLDGLLDVIEQLQGAPLPASMLEREILPARVEHYAGDLLDRLCASGELLWQGIEPLGSDDGRIALYLTDSFPLLGRIPEPAAGELAGRVRALLRECGALFLADIRARLDAFPKDIEQALWSLVWSGEVSNDTLAPLRALARGGGRLQPRAGRRHAGAGLPGSAFRSRRREGPPGMEGRWSLLPQARAPVTARQAALAEALIARQGVLTREGVLAEGVSGGFAALYPVLRLLEEGGRVRRGYFVAGLGAAQFAAPGAPERLRERPGPATGELLLLAATDPANPWGAALGWPTTVAGSRPQRVAGARVALFAGELVAYLPRGGGQIVCFGIADPARAALAHERLVQALVARVAVGGSLFIGRVDGLPPFESVLAPALAAAGFLRAREGAMWRPPVTVARAGQADAPRRRLAARHRLLDPADGLSGD